MLTEPETAGQYTQVIGRLRRVGAKAKTIFVHRIHGKDTIDEDQDARVHGGIDQMQRLLDGMKKRNNIGG